MAAGWAPRQVNFTPSARAAHPHRPRRRRPAAELLDMANGRSAAAEDAGYQARPAVHHGGRRGQRLSQARAAADRPSTWRLAENHPWFKRARRSGRVPRGLHGDTVPAQSPISPRRADAGSAASGRHSLRPILGCGVIMEPRTQFRRCRSVSQSGNRWPKGNSARSPSGVRGSPCSSHTPNQGRRLAHAAGPA